MNEVISDQFDVSYDEHIGGRAICQRQEVVGMGHAEVARLDEYVQHVAGDSYALLSCDPAARHVAIFVHGFGGDPAKTWYDMPSMIDADAGWSEFDAYFVGYDSTGDEVMLSASYMARIIREICPEPPDGLFVARSHRLRPKGTKYESVTLVGHSLGGVILRIAVLELMRQGFIAARSDDASKLAEEYALPCQAKLRLFAPAQGGARIAGAVGVLRQAPFVRRLGDLFQGHSPSYQELGPGSSILHMLREDTNCYAERFPEFAALRARIVWAHRDNIVTSMPFRHDFSYTMRDTDHVSVCKPSTKSPASFNFIRDGIVRPEGGSL